MPDALARELSILWQTIDGTKLLAALLVLVVGLGIAVAMARVCDRHLRRFFPRSSPASRALIARTLRLIVIALSVLMALQILGISITSLLAAGTVIFVGIGLAIQQILQSLIAGTLLLLEREIEPGDVIRYAGEEYKVSRIGLRTTQMESRFAETLILPNYLLATAPVMNLTHRETTVVARLTVQVAYGADSDVVERALLEAADDLPGRIDAPAQALLQSFDDSGITWLLRVPIDDPWRLPQRTSALGRRVIDAFAQAGITIPFPQRDVHLQPAPDA